MNFNKIALVFILITQAVIATEINIDKENAFIRNKAERQGININKVMKKFENALEQERENPLLLAYALIGFLFMEKCEVTNIQNLKETCNDFLRITNTFLQQVQREMGKK